VTWATITKNAHSQTLSRIRRLAGHRTGFTLVEVERQRWIRAGYPISQWSVTFNGSVHGWPTMIGVLAILGGIVSFLIALIRVLME